MHFEILPSWAFPAFISLSCAIIAIVAWTHMKARRRRKSRSDRRRKSMAHTWAWNWVMGRRAQRLTDERSQTD